MLGGMNIAAVLELGALMGALIAGVYADRYSRRHSILLAASTSFLHKVVKKASWLTT